MLECSTQHADIALHMCGSKVAVGYDATVRGTFASCLNMVHARDKVRVVFLSVMRRRIFQCLVGCGSIVTWLCYLCLYSRVTGRATPGPAAATALDI